MPQYEIEVPGYGKYRVESPTELTDAQAYAAIQDQIGREPKPKTGVGAAVSRGLEGLLSSGRTAVGALTGNAEEAARAGIARGEDIQRRYANQTDMGRVTEAYNKDGILSAGRELVSQIPYALAEQAPNLAAMAGSARLGAMAGSAFGPIGTAVGGGLGAFAPSFLQQMGGNVERQAQEGQPVSTGTAAAAAAPQAALDLASQYVAFGGKLIQKLTGIPTQALFSKSAAQASKLADERLMTTLAKGTAVGAVAEIPTEIAQQMIERAQAGLPLTTPDALKEYGETAYQVGLLAPLGAVGRLSERGGARQQVAQTAQEESAAQAAQQQQVQQAQEQQQALLRDSPDYAKEVQAKYAAAVAQRQQLSDASKAPEGADPLAVADAAEAAKALKEFDKNVMSPLVEEARRVRALHPQFFQAPAAPTAPTPAAVAPTTPAPTGAEAAAAVAPTTQAPTGEETDTAYVAPYVQSLMQTPERAQQIVDNAEELPNLTAQQSETVRSVLKLLLKPTKRAKKAPAAPLAGAEGMSPERVDELEARAAAIMESPEIAADMVMKNEQIPGLTPEENTLFLEMLQQRLAQEELDAATASSEGFDADTVPPKTTTTPPTAEGEPDYSALDGSTKGTGTFTSRIVRGNRPPAKTRAELINDFRIARATRDRAGVEQAINAMRALTGLDNKTEDTNTLLPSGVTKDLATPLPRSVDRATDARIARGQAFAQLLMAKPIDVEAARGRLLERLSTDIEAGSGRRIPQSERYQLAAQANPILDAVLRDKTPENAKKAQDALNAIYNRFVSPGTEAAAPIVEKAKPEKELPVEKGAPAFEEQEPTADIRAAAEVALKSLLRDAEKARDKARVAFNQAVNEKMGTEFASLDSVSAQIPKLQDAIAAAPNDKNRKALQNRLNVARQTQAKLRAKLEDAKAAAMADPKLADSLRAANKAVGDLENLLAGDEKTGFAKLENYLATLQIRNPELQAYQKLLATERKDKLGPFVGPRKPRVGATEGPTAPEVRAEAAAKSSEKQERLEAIERARQSRGGARVSFEKRRLLADTEDATRAKLQAAAKDKNASIEERRDAQEALEAFDAKIAATVAKEEGGLTEALTKRNEKQATVDALLKKLENPTALLNAKDRERAERDEKYQAIIDSGGELNNKQKAYVARKGLMTREQLAQPYVDKLEEKLVTARVELEIADSKVAKRDRVQITPLLTKEEIAAEAKATTTTRRIDRVQAKLNKGQALNAQEAAFAKKNKLKANNAQVEGVEGEIRERERNRIQGKLDRNQLLTDEELKFVEDNRMLADERTAKIAATQKDRRATSAVTVEQTSAPSQFYTGKPEDTAKTKTRPKGAFESTKPKERNTIVGKKDQQAANEAADIIAAEKVADRKPLTAADIKLLDYRQHFALFEAAQNMRRGLEKNLADIDALLANAERSANPMAKDILLRKARLDTRDNILADIAVARANEIGLGKLFTDEDAAFEDVAVKTPRTKKTKTAKTRSKVLAETEELEAFEAPSRLDARRTNTPLSAQAVEMAQDGRILNLADELAKNGSTPAVREAAAKLRPLLMRTKLVVDAAVNYDGESVAGLYSPRNNTITMHPEGLTEEDVLHEMGHAATDYVLLADPATLTADQRAARKGLEALLASIKKSDSFKGEQGTANVREFAAEVLSNNDFRNKLDAVGKPTTLLQRIMGFFKRMLGMQTAMSSKEAQALVDRILAPSRRLVAKEAPSLFRKEASFTSKDALSSLAQKIVSQPAGYKERTGSNVMLKLEMNTTDMRAGLREALKAGAKAMGNDKLFTQAMYSVIKADQKMPMVMAALSNGPLKLYEDAKGFKGVTTTGKDSAKEVFDAISKIPDTYGDSRAKTALATSYMIAQRAANKGLSRLDTGALGVDQQQLAAAMRAVNADFALKNALESVRTKYNAYNAGMIQFLADTGALPKAKGAEMLKYGDYVPFYRVRSDGVAELVFGEEQTITIGDIRYQPHLAQLKGGEEKILPLDQSIYRNTILLTDKAMTNMAARNVAYALQTFGKTATKDLMPIHRGQGPTGPDIIRFSQEPDASIEGDTGQRWLQVRTEGTSMEGIPAELVVKSLEGAHLTLPAFLKWGQVAGDLLRAGVTRSPIYLMRQLFRDPMAASFTTGLNYNPLRAIFKANKEFLKISAGTSETGAKLIEKGLVQSGIFTGDPDDISKFALQLASGKDLGAIDKLFAMADKAAMNADTATRSLVYDNALANGLSEVEADMATMESMNFYKRGLSPTVQYAGRLIPFFNSQIQGLNVLYKAARGQMPFNEQLAIKRKFMNNAMLLMGVGVAYAMAMDDDEYYRNAKPKDRYSNFFLHLPGVDEPIKLPIPYEAGWFFSAAVAAVDAIKGETDGEQQLAALKDMFLGSIPGFSSKFVPQIFKPAAEVYTNKQFYNGQDLESTRLQKLTPDQRYNRNTTELAKAVSKVVPILSPIQIEHIVSGYLGQLPIMAMAAADGLFTPDQSVEEPTRRTSEWPVFGSSFQRKYGGADADVVYKLAEDALQSKASLDALLSTGKAEDAKEYRQEHMAEIAVAPIAKQYQTFMGTLRKQEEIIRASKSYTADQKRERIDNIDKQRQLQSEKFLQAIKRAEAAVGA